MEQDLSERVTPSRLLIPAMAVGFVSIAITDALLTIFSVDIASAFKVPVGIVLQLSTINNLGMFIFSLLMGALVVRFKLRPLLLAGVFFVIVSAVGNFLAPNFLTMVFFFLMEGIGSVLFLVMGQTLFGNVFNQKKRAKAISFTMSAGWATGLFGPTVVGFIAAMVGWRSNFLLWVLPWSLVGLALVFFAVPSDSNAAHATVEKVPIGAAFKSVLKNRSATACLAANTLAVASVQVGVFAIPFYRQVFLLPLAYAVGWVTVVAGIFVVGTLVGGRLVNRFGSKPIAVAGTFLTGVFTMIFFFIPTLWITLIFDSLHVISAAIALPAYACLALAQVPKSRGTMMSLNQAMDNFGKTFAPAVGGTLLIITLGVYGSVGLMLGSLSIVSAVVLFLFARDPTKT